VKQDVSFLHIADVHLNSKYLGLGEEKRSIRLLETQLTLKKVICENDDAKIILFAGGVAVLDTMLATAPEVNSAIAIAVSSTAISCERVLQDAVMRATSPIIQRSRSRECTP